MDNRQPMTPSEFDAACRILERDFPYISVTSGFRSAEHNASIDPPGHPESKHLIGMARDYKCPGDMLKPSAGYLVKLGLWFKYYTWGFHVQGLIKGPLEQWWIEKYIE